METPARKRANRQWRKRHKDKARYDSYKSTCKMFLSRLIKSKDIPEMQKLIINRKHQLVGLNSERR